MSLLRVLGALWDALNCGLWHHAICDCYKGKPSAPVPLLELPKGLQFDWLRDYGPHWRPGSTAFWLEPETHDELASWYAKYRPDVTGFVEAAGLRIEIVPAGLVPHRTNPKYVNYANQLRGGLAGYYNASPRNTLPGGWF